MSKFPQAKTCPSCGHDTFRVAKTWTGEERFFQRSPKSFGKESDMDEEEYHLIQCADCGHEIGDVNELYLQRSVKT